MVTAMLCLGFLLILLGAVVFVAEARRLAFPRLFLNRTSEASLKFSVLAMRAPYPLIFATVLVFGGYWIATHASDLGCTQEISALNHRLQRSVVVADSIEGRIRDLQAIKASLARGDQGGMFAEIAFGAATPIPLLGRGATGMLQSTSDPHVDLMIFHGTMGYSDDLKSQFDPIVASTGFRFTIGKRFFLKAQDEKLWGVNVITRVDQNAIRCQFFEP
ncbi:MAG: hypothetical protein ACYDIE_01400 [Candidatus Krumholzibacteriia bacterium]